MVLDLLLTSMKDSGKPPKASAARIFAGLGSFGGPLKKTYESHATIKTFRSARVLAIVKGSTYEEDGTGAKATLVDVLLASGDCPPRSISAAIEQFLATIGHTVVARFPSQRSRYFREALDAGMKVVHETTKGVIVARVLSPVSPP